MSHQLKELLHQARQSTSQTKVSASDSADLIALVEDEIDNIKQKLLELDHELSIVEADITTETDPIWAFHCGRCSLAREILEMMGHVD